MTVSNIEVVEIGIPGPPGAGVSPAEKASFVTLADHNIFTGQNEIRKTSGQALVISSGAAAADRTLSVISDVKQVNVLNGASIMGYSDAGVTQTYSIDAATGTLVMAGGLQASSYKGEQLWLAWSIDGGAAPLTPGVKVRWLIPYDCQITPDPNLLATWQVGLDQSGSIGFDLWQDRYANYPPTNADRISGTLGTQNPRVSGAIKGYGVSPTGWSTTLTKGSWLFIAIDSVSTATWATLGLHITKT